MQRRTATKPTARLLFGDCREVLPTLGERFHSCVTDPPYNLGTMSSPGGAPMFQGLARGFLGKTWDNDIAFKPDTWKAIYNVMLPGAYIAVFGGTRRWHRVACAIEDAGFVIRDTLAWLYASGFPKGLDIAKAIDKKEGNWRGRAGDKVPDGKRAFGQHYVRVDKGEPISDLAKQWDGWNTTLKPGVEPIILAQKPCEGSITANVLKYGCGALNIGACMIGNEVRVNGPRSTRKPLTMMNGGNADAESHIVEGYWPSNVILDSSEVVSRMFPEGIAGRFFYNAKANVNDRDEGRTTHPTVKPTDLMRWLVQLVTPRGGVVLDPFAGTASTLLAVHQLVDIRAIGIEADPTYHKEASAKLRAGMGLFASVATV